MRLYVTSANGLFQCLWVGESMAEEEKIFTIKDIRALARKLEEQNSLTLFLSHKDRTDVVLLLRDFANFIEFTGWTPPKATRVH